MCVCVCVCVTYRLYSIHHTVQLQGLQETCIIGCRDYTTTLETNKKQVPLTQDYSISVEKTQCLCSKPLALRLEPLTHCSASIQVDCCQLVFLGCLV